MKKIFAPVLAAAISTSACGSSSRNVMFPSTLSDDCETKECYLEKKFGVKSEGLQENGTLVICVDNFATPEGIIADAKAQYDKIHGCVQSDPTRKFDVEGTFNHHSSESINGIMTQTHLTCALVNDTNLTSGEHCPESK